MCVKRVLILSGGVAGMAAAIALAKNGAQVDYVEPDGRWRGRALGVSLGSQALRAARLLGIADAVVAQGAGSDGVSLFSASGKPLAMFRAPRMAGPALPGRAAILKPRLLSIMLEAMTAGGVRQRLGVGVRDLRQLGSEVAVAFDDDASQHYDLVIGADGPRSWLQDSLFPAAPDRHFTGPAMWRTVVSRADGIDGPVMWWDRSVKLGVTPLSDDKMEVSASVSGTVANGRTAAALTPFDQLLASFEAPQVQQIRALLRSERPAARRHQDGLLMPLPWIAGRVAMLGDAVHAAAPHLGLGACLGIEDGVAIAAMLKRHPHVDLALRAFQERRWPRCRMVVENAARLAEAAAFHGDHTRQIRVMRETLLMLNLPL